MGKVIAVGGATASGKTTLAIELARRHGTEIISADSRQFYREMRIGNARPTPEELAAVPHHFVADRSVTEPLSAGRFAVEAQELLDQLFERYETVVVVGGSGLYIRALCEGLDEFPTVTEGARTRVQGWAQGSNGLHRLQTELAARDPAYYAVVDRDNPRRLTRALEVCLSAGQPYSSYLGNATKPHFETEYVKTRWPRAELYARINARVDAMIAAGLEEEARALLPHRDLPALQTVGYREWWPYFAGEYDWGRVVELIKRNSRRYAKRQETWFGRWGRG